MSLEKVESCPVCNGQSFQPILVCKDHTASGELFHVEQCADCKLLLTNPRPTQSDATPYYESAQYISHQSTATGLIDYIYLIIRKFTLRWKHSLIKPHLLKNRLLDIGCGTGTFLEYCQRSGIQVMGIEPSSGARNQACSRGLTVIDSTKNLPPQQFDVITLWHVLEHIYDLRSTLATLRNLLDERGTIFIAVPNYQSYDAEYYREYWAAYDVPRHVYHFGKEAMLRLLKSSGYTLKEIIPMKLDAYYVSLLSEKYIAGGRLSLQQSIHAIKTAYQSNGLAKLDMNYSSLIYIAQK